MYDETQTDEVNYERFINELKEEYAANDDSFTILVNGKDIKKMEIKYAPKVTKKYNKEIADKLKIKVPEGYEEIGE